jgi:hypothetical protein
MHLLELSFTDAVEWLERQFLPATRASDPTNSAVPSVSGSAVSSASGSAWPASVSSRLARPLHLSSPAAGKLADVCHYLTDRRHLLLSTAWRLHLHLDGRRASQHRVAAHTPESRLRSPQRLRRRRRGSRRRPRHAAGLSTDPAAQPARQGLERRPAPLVIANLPPSRRTRYPSAPKGSV